MSTFHARICWLQEYESFESERQKKKTQGELAQVQWVSLHMQGESSPSAPAPPVQTLVSSKHEPQETTGKAYNTSSKIAFFLPF